MIASSLHTNPFPGIRSYEVEEDDLFFGRESQVRELIGKLAQTRFLAIVGSSGCGKSSLVKAGLVPSLLRKKDPQLLSDWRLIVFRPTDDPIGNLARCTAGRDLTADRSAALLRSGPDGLIRVLEEQQGNPGESVLINIDQFEELFRFKKSGSTEHSVAEAAAFVDLILHSIHQREKPIYVVISMRTDFLDDCTEFRGLSEIINQGYYLVPRMNAEERRLAITGPILAKGSRITDELVERLLREVGDDPDQLPILQHALMRTWDHWMMNRIGDQSIGSEHYEAIGTMKEALSVHLEEIYVELNDENSRFITEKLFKALTEVSKEKRGTRRPTPLGEICTLAGAKEESVVNVINAFRDTGRAFLMPSRRLELDRDSIIDISHESIMRVWTRLKKWVEEESTSAQLYLRLSKSAELYQEGKSGLWVNPELQLALQWRDQNKPNATWAMRYDPAFDRAIGFLDYSRKQSELEIAKKENQQKRNLKRARQSAIILGTAAIISILFLIISLNLRFKAEASRKEAIEKEKLAVTERKKTDEQRKEAILQKKISEQQQQIAEQQKIITEQQRQYAVKQQVIAQEQRAEAVEQKQKADEATVEAVKAKDEADDQRKEAVSQKVIADRERIKAEESEKNTQRLRLLSIARSMAIQANQIFTTVKDDLPALLAVQAYLFNVENGGVPNNPDIYAALSTIVNDQLILRGHEDAVRGIALAPGGKFLVSCGDDGKLYRWNPSDQAAAPVLYKLPKGLNEKFRSVLITHDGNSVIAGTVSGRIYLLNADPSVASVRVLNGHTSIVNALALHPSLNQFASAGSDGRLILWSFTTDRYTPLLLDSSAAKIHAVTFARGGATLAFGGSDGKLYTLDPRQGHTSSSILFSSPDPLLSLASSNDGTMLAAGFSNGSIRIWDLSANGPPPIELIGRHFSGVTGLAFSPDGNNLASCGYDRSVKIGTRKSSEGKPVSIEKHDLWVYGVLFTPEGGRLISCSADKSIRLFSTSCQVLSERLAKTLKRNLTQEEWNKYVGADIPYRNTKP
jgi:energy-coupling factor transporter ATP-binding protein EcfA2